MAIETVYRLRFPNAFRQWVEFFASVISIDLITLGVPFACVGVNTFHAKLWVYIIGPLAVIGITLCWAAGSVLIRYFRGARGWRSMGSGGGGGDGSGVRVRLPRSSVCDSGAHACSATD